MKKVKIAPHAKFLFLRSDRCGAKSKRHNGRPCRQPAMPNGKCRLHGGMSTGPKTVEGKQRAALANYKSGHYTKEALAEEKRLRALYRDLRTWLK